MIVGLRATGGTSVRRRVTSQLRGRRVRATDPEYGIRRRLQRNREDLNDEQFADMWNRLIDLGAPGEQILTVDRQGGTA
jgi:transposase